MKMAGAPRALVVLLPVLAIAGAVLAFLLVDRSSGTPDAAAVLARAQAAEEEALSQLTEGKVLHVQDRIYKRHGPAAETIKDRSSEWYLPETRVTDTWAEVGTGGEIVRIWGLVKDERTGSLLQRTVTTGSEIVIQDVATGEEKQIPFAVSVQDLLTRLNEAIEARAEQSQSGSEVSGEEMIGNRTVIVLDGPASPYLSAVAEQKSTFAGGGYSLPYVVDLEPVSIFRRVTVDKESFVPLRWSFVVVDAAGNEYIIKERQRLVFEAIDVSQVPIILGAR